MEYLLDERIRILDIKETCIVNDALPGNYSIPFSIGLQYEIEHFSFTSPPLVNPNPDNYDSAVVLLSHIDRFPDDTTKYNSKEPCIFQGMNVKNCFPSEFTKYAQGYIKGSYTSYRPQIKLNVLVSPSEEQIMQLNHPTSGQKRILHYIGFGYPTINEKQIWCSKDHIFASECHPIDIESIINHSGPIGWFIFDCNNSASILQSLPKNSFFIGATDVNEVLPNDPYLPKDFLTSCLFSPVKTAAICYLCQNCRHQLTPDFQIGEAELARLSFALTSILDAIAIDSLPEDLYTKIAKGDKLSSLFFRHFILSQRLLVPYKCHPVSYPHIPNLSKHPYWKNWEILLAATLSRKTYTRPLEISSNMIQTIRAILKSGSAASITRGQLCILFHQATSNVNDQEAIGLLSKYISLPDSNLKSFVLASEFSTLFAKYASTLSHDLEFIVLALLIENPRYVNDIQKVSLKKILSALFKHHCPYIAAIITSLVLTHDQLGLDCQKSSFIESLTCELKETNDFSYSLLILVLFSRIFLLSRPRFHVHLQTGMFVRISQFLFHNNPLHRASAAASLRGLILNFSCPFNSQILLLIAFLFNDASYLVRFQVVMAVKQYLLTLKQIPHPESKFGNIQEMKNRFFGLKEISDFTSLSNYIDSIDNLEQHAALIASTLLHFFKSDPHPTIVKVANLSRDLCKEGENELFKQLAENELLYHIVISQLIRNGFQAPVDDIEQVEPGDSEKYIPSSSMFVRYKSTTHPGTIRHLAFDRNSLGLALSTDTSIRFIDDQLKTVATDYSGKVNSLAVANFYHKPRVCAGTATGTVYIWSTKDNNIESIRVCPTNSPVIVTTPDRSVLIACSRSITEWDLKTMKMTREWPISATCITTVDKRLIVVGDQSGFVKIIDRLSGEIVDSFTAFKCPVSYLGVNSCYFAATDDGEWVSWEGLNSKMMRRGKREGGFQTFLVNRFYPFIVIGPHIMSLDMKAISQIRDVEGGNVWAMHHLLPVMATSIGGEVRVLILSQS